MFELNGYKVNFHHEKFDVPFELPQNWGIISIKGTTACEIRGNGKAYRGTTFCSAKDMFNRNTGRKIALGRALKEAGFDRETRKQFWSEYFKVHGKIE